MNLISARLLVALGVLAVAAASQGEVERYKDEAQYLARLSELGYETLVEDFEGAAWDGVRSDFPVKNYAASITTQRVTWASAGRDLWTFPGTPALVSTNQNWGRNGTWGIYDNYLASTLRITVPEPIFGIGFWVNTNPDGEDVGILFKDRTTATVPGHMVPGYGAMYPGDIHPVGHTFVGFVDSDGFTEVVITGTLQIDEDGVLEGAAVYGADDFTLGVTSDFPLSPLEEWREAHFTKAELANMALEATVWGLAADPDSDGLANDYEFALGTDPRDTRDNDGIAATVVDTGGETLMRLSFRRRNDDPGLVVEAERSGDLSSWLSGPSFVETVSSVDLKDGYERVTVQAVAPVPPTHRTFMRVVVVRSEP